MAEFKRERASVWVEKWDESQWNATEFRLYLVNCLRDAEAAQDRLSEIEPLYEEQARYIKYLERQLELLQKTLDLAEKFAPRPIILPGSSEVIK
jgi:hypothetical protein